MEINNLNQTTIMLKKKWRHEIITEMSYHIGNRIDKYEKILRYIKIILNVSGKADNQINVILRNQNSSYHKSKFYFLVIIYYN